MNHITAHDPLKVSCVFGSHLVNGMKLHQYVSSLSGDITQVTNYCY